MWNYFQFLFCCQGGGFGGVFFNGGINSDNLGTYLINKILMDDGQKQNFVPTFFNKIPSNQGRRCWFNEEDVLESDESKDVSNTGMSPER